MLVVRVLCEACDFILFDTPEGVRRNPFLRLRQVLDDSGGDAILANRPVITHVFCHSLWACHPCFPLASEAKLVVGIRPNAIVARIDCEKSISYPRDRVR